MLIRWDPFRILTLHLPKTEEVKPKKIAIQGGASKMIEGKLK